MKKKISVKEAAEIMGKSQQFVRIGLQRGLLPFGTAIKMSSMYTYYISPKLFYEYVGSKELDDLNISDNEEETNGKEI